MANGTITFEMLDRPVINLIYAYFHHTCFCLTTVLMSIGIFVVYKKSPKEMGHYKYLLLYQLVSVYAAELYYYMWRPINGFPYITIYPAGPFELLPAQAVIPTIYGVLALLVGIVHSLLINLLFRVSQIFYNTTFYHLFNKPRDLLKLFLISFVMFQFIVFVPFIGFFFHPYDYQVAIKTITQEEPAYIELIKQHPKFSGCDWSDSCQPFITLAIIVYLPFTLFIIIMILATYYLYYKQNQFLKSMLIDRASDLNNMLFRALTIQYSLYLLLIIPSVILLEFGAFSRPK
uniref:Uncharacterized protein n=1 Tax=Acrobeloides nanus TaxID=290746 RepID=A0A914C545_9BILA